MKVSKEANAIGDAANNLGSRLKSSFSISGWKAASAEAAEVAAERTARVASRNSGLGSKALRGLGSMVTYPFRVAGSIAGSTVEAGASAGVKTGLWAAEQPVALAMKPVKWSLNAVAKGFERYPRLAPVASVAAATLGGLHLISRHNAKKAEAHYEYAQQMQAMQMMQAQAAAQQQTPVSYKNSASQADVDARIAADRAAGAAPTSQTAALASRQAAAAAAPAV